MNIIIVMYTICVANIQKTGRNESLLPVFFCFRVIFYHQRPREPPELPRVEPLPPRVEPLVEVLLEVDDELERWGVEVVVAERWGVAFVERWVVVAEPVLERVVPLLPRCEPPKVWGREVVVAERLTFCPAPWFICPLPWGVFPPWFTCPPCVFCVPAP